MTINISNLSISNNVQTGTNIGVLVTTDASGNAISCAYTLNKGSAGYFAISDNELVTAWSAPIAPGYYSVRVRATGNTAPFRDSGTFVVNVVTAVPAPPPPPPPPPPSVSPDGSIISGGTGSLQTADGTWGFGAASAQYPGNWLILLNGAQAGSGIGSELEVADGGQMYAVGTDNNWYVWQNSGWVVAANPNPPPPPPPPAPVSPDGSVISGGTGSLQTAEVTSVKRV